MPTPIEEHPLTTADGIRLHVERHRPEGPVRGVLIFLHGFSTHIGPYRHVAGAFATAGMDVTAFDCRGHGRSDGRRGYVRRFSDFTDDLGAVVHAARAACPNVPLAVLGHSQGGTVALAYALKERGAVDALLLAAPWLGLAMPVPVAKRMIAPLLGVVWPTLALSSGIRAEDVTRDPLVQARLRADPLIHHVATARWFNEARATQAHILREAATLQVPTYISIPGDDRIADAQATIAFARSAGPIVQTTTTAGAFHELFLEPERELIVNEFVSWLVARLNSRIIGGP